MNYIVESMLLVLLIAVLLILHILLRLMDTITNLGTESRISRMRISKLHEDALEGVIFLNGRFNDVDVRFNAVETHFNDVDVHFNDIDARIDEIDRNLQHLDNSLHERLHQLHDDVRTVVQYIQDLE